MMTTAFDYLLYGVGLYFIVFFGHLSSLYFFRWRERIIKQRMIEDFIDHFYQQAKTEEDFNDIVKRLRRDFGDGAGV